MSIDLTIPRLEMSMSEGVLAEWLVADGATVAEGEPLYVLETDKAAQEIAAPASGTVRHLVEPGATYDVGTRIGTIGSS